MKINYNVQGKERKALVNIIAEAINEEAVYEKAPTYNYTIGDFTVTRDGELEFDSATTDDEQVRTVLELLKENGFDCDDSENIAISFPLEGFTDEALGNLKKLIDSKATLIKKALGVEDLPIEIGEDEISFDWFSGENSHETVHAYSQFICQLCKTAKDKKRVTAKAQDEFENEKFAMRVWLIGLGMVGAEFATARKLLMQNLDGNSSWRYGNENGGLSPRRERVHREVVSVRFTPETLEQLAELASQCNMSRNQLIESVVCEYVQAEFSADLDEEGAVETAPDSPEDGESEVQDDE